MLQNFHVLKFRVKFFFIQIDIRYEKLTQCYRETWRNLTELVFVDTMSTKKYGRQLHVGEELACTTEPHNSHDRYAVSVKAFLATVLG